MARAKNKYTTDKEMTFDELFKTAEDFSKFVHNTTSEKFKVKIVVEPIKEEK